MFFVKNSRSSIKESTVKRTGLFLISYPIINHYWHKWILLIYCWFKMARSVVDWFTSHSSFAEVVLSLSWFFFSFADKKNITCRESKKNFKQVRINTHHGSSMNLILFTHAGLFTALQTFLVKYLSGLITKHEK